MLKLSDLECTNQDIDINTYYNFTEQRKKSMDHPEWLGDFTKDEISQLLLTGSKIWIYYLNKDVVCSMMMIPASKKSVAKLGLNNYNNIVDYGPMMVGEKYIGNKLQLQMLNIINAYCKNNGYEYVATTIHPDNKFSINNILKNGFDLIDTKQFSRGLRNIYLKKL